MKIIVFSRDPSDWKNMTGDRDFPSGDASRIAGWVFEKDRISNATDIRRADFILVYNKDDIHNIVEHAENGSFVIVHRGDRENGPSEFDEVYSHSPSDYIYQEFLKPIMEARKHHDPERAKEKFDELGEILGNHHHKIERLLVELLDRIYYGILGDDYYNKSYLKNDISSTERKIKDVCSNLAGKTGWEAAWKSVETAAERLVQSLDGSPSDRPQAEIEAVQLALIEFRDRLFGADEGADGFVSIWRT